VTGRALDIAIPGAEFSAAEIRAGDRNAAGYFITYCFYDYFFVFFAYDRISRDPSGPHRIFPENDHFIMISNR
jgi:hypothetical protein